MKAIKLNDDSGPLKLVSVPVNYPPPSGGGLLDRDVCLLYFHLSKCSLINAKVLQADVDYKNYYQLQRRPVSELLQLHKCSTKSSKKVMKVFRCCTTHLPTYLPTDPPTYQPTYLLTSLCSCSKKYLLIVLTSRYIDQHPLNVVFVVSFTLKIY